eukprot:840000-Pelagomonas_calceolata.AAC.1
MSPAYPSADGWRLHIFLPLLGDDLFWPCADQDSNLGPSGNPCTRDASRQFGGWLDHRAHPELRLPLLRGQ